MILLSIGKKGYGKSTLLRTLACRALAESQPPPILFFDDPQGGLAVPPSHVFTSTAQWRATKRIPALSVFRGVHPNELARLACDVGDVTLVLDEIDRASENKRWHTSKHLATDVCPDGAWVKRVVHEGRHYRVSLWGSARRFASVPEDLISQADVLFLFRVDDWAAFDVDMTRRRFGEEAAEAVQSLERGQYLTFGEL